MRWTFALAIACFFVMEPFRSIPMADDAKKGLITYVDGSVKKKKTVELEWQATKENTEVISGESVRTMSQSRAELTMAQLDVVRLAPRTTVDIVRLFEETKEEVKRTALEVEEGDVWANLGSLSADAEFTISTKIATAAVRGTVFRMGATEDQGTELRVYRGSVEISNRPKETEPPQDLKGPEEIRGPEQVPGPEEVEGPAEVTLEQWTYIVQAMQKIVISPDQKVLFHGRFNSDEPEEQSEWVRWNMERDKESGLEDR